MCLSPGCRLFWISVYPEQDPAGSVLLVLGRDGSGRWYELQQTSSRSVLLPSASLAKLTLLRVLSVDRDGDVETAELIVPEREHHCSQPAAEELKPSLITPELKSSWQPELESIRPAPGYHLAVVEWEERPGPALYPAKYMVRWEAGEQVGMLLTNTTSVGVPVGPGADLQVEVSLLGTSRVSSPLLIPASGGKDVDGGSLTASGVGEGDGGSLTASVVLSVFATALVFSLVMLLLLLRLYSSARGGAIQNRGGATRSKDGGIWSTDGDSPGFSSPPDRSTATRATLVSFESFLRNNRLSVRDLGLDLGLEESYSSDPNLKF